MATLLQVHELTKRYGAVAAADRLTFRMDAGRCVALLGPNGAGKTTTLKMLAGLLAPSTGRVDFIGLSPGEDRRRQIGYLPQYPAFYSWMSGKEFLLYAGRLSRLGRKEAESRAVEMLALVGLEQAGNKRIGGYSGGMKQRLGLAQAMIHKPRLLMLDEPVSALDPFGRREVLGLLRRLKQESTILFSTHVLHDAENICDDILIMQSGAIAIQGSLEEVRRKYQQPIISIRVEPSACAWLDGLAELPYVREVNVEGSEAQVIVSADDLALARRTLLEHILKHQVAVERYEVGRTSLEDLFLKVVKS